MQYGILIGRFQPLHNGHMTIIDEIINDGLRPLVLVGSSNVWDIKNPLSYIQRADMIHDVYSGRVTTFPLPDLPSNEDWVKNLLGILHAANIHEGNCKVYLYQKPDDFWLEPWLVNHFKIHRPTSVMPNVCASQIRENPTAFKEFMNLKVYHKFKSIQNANNIRTGVQHKA